MPRSDRTILTKVHDLAIFASQERFVAHCVNTNKQLFEDLSKLVYLGAERPQISGEHCVVEASDVILVPSVFVLGGDSWDKVRVLSVEGAQVMTPAAGTIARLHCELGEKVKEGLVTL